MSQVHRNDLLATLVHFSAHPEDSGPPRERFHPWLRALTEGLSLAGVAVWEAGADGFSLLAQHGLPAAWAEGATTLDGDSPVAAAASRVCGPAILDGDLGLPLLPGPARAAAAVSLKVGTRTVGLLVALAERPETFGDGVRDLLGPVATLLAGALASEQRLKQANARAEHLAAMAAVARTLTSSLEERTVFECIVRAAVDLLGADMARLWVHERDRDLLKVAAGAGAPGFPIPPGDTIAPGEGLVGTVFAERGPGVVVDPERDPINGQQAWAGATGVRAAAAVPVIMGDRALGVLSVLFRERPHLGHEELNLLTSFADQAAVAMENARLYQDLKAYSAGLEEKVRERTAALEAANVQLREANRIKSAFLANMSHELRTPLTSTIGFSEFMLGGTIGPLTERQRLYVRTILSNGQHLLSLVNDILDLSKIEAGKVELHLVQLPVGEALAEAVEAIRGQAIGKAVSLALEVEPGLPVVTADPGKFRQICLNLLSNAVKFSPDGGRVSVSAWAASLEGPRGPVPAVEVAVADTGIGIEPADQERIFREFEQVEDPSGQTYPGTGLGLALTRWLVELHGGTIRVESAGAGRGSTFRLCLPFRPPILEGEILLVDDDPEILRALAETFTRQGYGVRVVRDGEEALAAVAAARPTCIVLDLQMPRLNGLQVLQALREQEGTRSLPVVTLTGRGQRQGREALRLGAQEFLTKPVSSSVLVATVDRLIQRAAQERQR